MSSPLRADGSTRADGRARAGNGQAPAEAVETPDEIRRVLARELHDRVAQTLTSMLIELENFKIDQTDNQIVVKEVNSLQESTREVINNLRHVLYDLRGHNGMEEGFVDTVRALLARFQEKSQVKAILSISPTWPPKLRSSAALNLLRIIEEALNNVRQHSGARLVEVVLGFAVDGEIAVEVKDDGRGASSDVVLRQPGLGTLGMRERALMLGGRLEVLSVAGGGTLVRAILPKEQLT